MTLPDWLEKAYAEGRISIAEALNVNRSKNRDWKILLEDYNLTFSEAKEVIKSTENTGRPLGRAVAAIRSSCTEKNTGRPPGKAVAAVRSDCTDEKSRRVREEDKMISKKLGKDLRKVLEDAEAAKRRGPLDQIRFFIESWEFNYIQRRAYISPADAKTLRMLIAEARPEVKTAMDSEMVRRAERVAGAIRKRGLMPLNQKPRLIFTPTGGSQKRK